jgi:meso-butanediol dehydrogenase / (S,S)-butanediol dehydrogenase / diacetyl reductase
VRGLEGKRVVITGGGRGIGAATAQRFLEEGARVVIVDSDPGAADALRATHPGLTAAITADVADDDAVARAFDEVDARLGGVDVAIANAGISLRRPFLEITPEEWRRVVAVNLDGVFHVARHAAPRMLAAGGGVILSTASTSGLNGYPLYADYNAAKAGVIELTRTLALELAPTIRVATVCPGYVWTPMQEAEYTPEMRAAVDARIPLRRHARPEEIAALFAFLASDEAPYITGHPVLIDGGEIAGGLASR